MAALTRWSMFAAALATAANAAACPDAHIPALDDQKLSAGLRAAYIEGGGDIELASICNGYQADSRGAGADSLLVTLAPGARIDLAAAHERQRSNKVQTFHEARDLSPVEEALNPCRANDSQVVGLSVTQCHTQDSWIVISTPGGSSGIAAGATVSVRQLGMLIADPAVRQIEVDCRYALKGATTKPTTAGCPRKFPCKPGARGCAERASCTIEPPPALQRWTDGKLWGPESIGALNVYDALPDMSDDGLLIAVLDTGVHYRHHVFEGRIWENAAEAAGADGVDDDDNGCVDDLHGCAFQYDSDCDHNSNDLDANCDPVDLSGHGSKVAEVIATLGPGKILPVRIGNFSAGFSRSNYLAAITYVDSFARRYPGLRTIVNLSQTMAAQNASPAIGHAIANSPSLFVISVGNYSKIDYPAAYGYDNVIQVSAIGPHACDEPPALTSFIFNDEVDLVGPGTEICTSFDCPDGASECLTQGTSLAAPHVTAAAAMYLHENPSATAQQARATLIEQAGALKSVDISFLVDEPRRCACDSNAD